ncbi:hypothetical protein [Soonwooa sp.]|uniref:hypothetical protein n=1 Tax=Soonwooa sp. TaxID=1938592 RepID=UPI00260CC922|nr:hypothetical protein [Soonwooa sp.]
MNKKAVAFLLTMMFLPLTCFFGYWFFVAISDKRSNKEIYLDMRRELHYEFKIERIYRDDRGHNAVTLKGINKEDYTTVPPKWENGIFEVGDSIVKKKDSLRIFLYRNQKLDTILDYHNIFIREDI